MRLRALRAAFPTTIPILTGFGFLGLAYGIYMNTSGFSFVYPMLMSIVIFGGSLQFVAVEMLLSPYAPMQVLIMALLIQARHLFYGLSMLEKYKHMGWKKIYLIYALCDESFSVNYSAKIPEDVDRGWFYFWVTLLNQIYWVVAATLGGILGSFLTINTDGISFVMTAMFVVIYVDNWLKDKKNPAIYLGLGIATLCLVLFGADSFMIPTMLLIIAVLAILRKPLEGRKEELS